VFFTLWNNHGESVTVQEILHIYQNMESHFQYTFDAHTTLLRFILDAWDGSSWNFADRGIVAGHFSIAGINGVNDGNFSDIVRWFTSLSSEFSAPTYSGELRRLTDAALISIASEDANFRYAGNYRHRGEVEVAIAELVQNASSITFYWTDNRTVTVSVGHSYAVQITFSADIGLPPTPQAGDRLVDWLAYLRMFAQSGGTYNIVIGGNEDISPLQAALPNVWDLTINLSGNMPSTISLASNGSLFRVGSGVTLVLGNNIILQGKDGNDNPLVRVYYDGTLIMNAGARITGNVNTNASCCCRASGGVHVNSGGTFTMYGGEISGNISNSDTWVGSGGVLNDGTFNMRGGVISGNTAPQYGGAVYNTGAFNMESGIIFGNTGTGVRNRSTFRISNGVIYGNDAAAGLGNTTGALSDCCCGTTQLGTFSGDNFIPSDWRLITIDPTIEVVNGTLVRPVGIPVNTISFNTNNASGLPPGPWTVAGHSGWIRLPGSGDLQKSGYIFYAWNTMPDGTGNHYWSGGALYVSGNITVYAMWVSGIAVTFNANSASGQPPDPQGLVHADWIQLPGQGNMWRDGYAFGGWNTEPDGSGNHFWPWNSFWLYHDITLYAVWIPLRTITFDANSASGQPPGPWTFEYNEWIQLPDQGNMWRDGYVFGGWNTMPDGTGNHYWPGDTLYVSGNITLYAQWAGIGALAARLEWLRNNTQDGGTYTIDISVYGAVNLLSPLEAELPSGRNNLTIILMGSTPSTIGLSDYGSLFWVDYGVTLVLDNNVTLQGRNDNIGAMVRVYSGGTLEMNAGSVITGNVNTTDSVIDTGGGVSNRGTFYMRGGRISNNSSAHGGGVVNVDGGLFYMYAGTISNNTATSNAGGVAVWFGNPELDRSSTFNMHGGSISGNTAQFGGGVLAAHGGTFVMHDGDIFENEATGQDNSNGGGVYVIGVIFGTGSGTGTFDMRGGRIFNNAATQAGGGVVNWTGGRFRMFDGEIFDNEARFGGGVSNFGAGWFTMTGGEIFGNTATQGGGINNQGGGGTIIRDGLIHGSNAGSLRNVATVGAAFLNLGEGSQFFTMLLDPDDHSFPDPAVGTPFPPGTNRQITLVVEDGLPVPVFSAASMTVTGLGNYTGTEVDLYLFIGADFDIFATETVTGASVNFETPLAEGTWLFMLEFWSENADADGGWELEGRYIAEGTLVEGSNTIALASFAPVTAAAFGNLSRSGMAAPQRLAPTVEGLTVPEDLARTERLMNQPNDTHLPSVRRAFEYQRLQQMPQERLQGLQ